MKANHLDSLVDLMRSVIEETGSNRKNISNSQHVEKYLKIFLECVEENNGDPLHHDIFGERLWTKLSRNANNHKLDAEEFMNTWNGWVYLYRYLKMKNKLR